MRWCTIVILLGFSQCINKPSHDNKLLLEDYKPKSIYNIPTTVVDKPRHKVIDMHSHPYAQSPEELSDWVNTIQELGIEKTVVLTYATGEKFDSLYGVYSGYGDLFEIWCGFDYTGYQEPGWAQKAIKELERCRTIGAKGVGELGDKGLGLMYSTPTPAPGLHIDDPRLQPVIRRCGELGMPINIHVAEPKWMYESIDHCNDGLMNAKKWKIDTGNPDVLGHAELIGTLRNALTQNPHTTFIACHFANCSYDLTILADLFDSHTNLYADISARYGETAPIPRHMGHFYHKYRDRLLFGTDMGTAPEMYGIVFRILETEDEHFYQQDYFNYHWPLHGFGLKEDILKKLYYENAKKILQP